MVFIHGGMLLSNDTRRRTLWSDGRVVWFDGAGNDAGNTGTRESETIWVALKH